MEKNIYIGNRYVPKIMGLWDSEKPYEGLSIVLWKGNSFTSKKQTPAGIDIENEEYWASTGNYNAQIENYRRDVKNFNDASVLADQTLQKNIDLTNEEIEKTLKKMNC